MNNPLLSVIIPMFNCGAVISRCLDSIDYPNSEIIVVDDGSTDSSADVVSEYQGRCANIKLIRKQNGGVSSARNAGIKSSTGKYVMFVDADDYIVPGGLCRILDIAETNNADIVTYGNITLHEGDPVDNKSVSNFNMQINIIEGRAAALKTYLIPDYLVWRSLFLRSIIVNHDIHFDEDLHLHEDDAFMGKFYCMASKVISTNLPLYRYIGSSPYSSTHRQSQERNRILIESGYLAILHRSDFIKERMPNEQFPLERYKYMRWVCSPRQAIEAGYNYREYVQILKRFGELGVWPVSYKWIKIAGWDYNWKIYIKKVLLTFLLNHPMISYPLELLRNN